MKIGQAFAASVALAILLILSGSFTQQRSASAQSTTRTFAGAFAGSGTFRDPVCTYTTTYTGTVTVSLLIGAAGVTGTARHLGRSTDTIAAG